MDKNTLLKAKKKEENLSKGFTFIEVCIVVLVFSVVISVIYGVFRSGLVVCRRVKEVSFKEKKIVLALERLTKQLKQIINLSEEELKFKGEKEEIVFIAFDSAVKGFVQHKYYFDKSRKKLMVATQTIEDVLNGTRKKKQRELISLNGFRVYYFGCDQETGEVFEAEAWEQEDLPLAVKIQATEYFPPIKKAKLGYVYVASGSKKKTLSYEKEVILEEDLRTITRRVFLPVSRHLRP